MNAITILVDSAVWEYVGTTRTKVSATPFLDSLKKESITATKLYSHAPFTDGATRSLYTGRNTLDDYSFFFKLNSSPSNHFKSFHDNGYETYGIYYPYYMYGREMQKYIDHSFYSSHFIFISEWHTFMWFAKIIKERDLNEREMILVRKRMDLMFEVWLDFYEDIKKNPSSMEMLKAPFKAFDIDKGIATLKEQYTLFHNDEENYIVNFLKCEGGIFRTIDGIDFDSLIDDSFIEDKIYKKHKNIFDKASRLNRKANIWKNMPSLKRCIYGLTRFVREKNIDEVKFLANFWYSLRTIKDMKIRSHKESWQEVSSCQSQMDLALKILKERKSSKPFYLSMHILEPHNYISCFTFDKKDEGLIDEEMRILDSFLDEVGANFTGNLLFFLSLRYVDYCIEKFCKSLQKLGLWDSTALLVVADHGSSYTFTPLHGARVNCFDDECYHIPMLLRVPGISPLEVNHYCNSKDVLPTFMDVLHLQQDPNFIGHSFLDKSYHWPNYVMTEYTGPGCPEVRGRRLWFSCRDNKYMVAYRVAVYEEFDDGELVEVHDLNKDKECYYNLNKSIDRKVIKYLLDIIEQRFEEVKKDSQLFIENIQ